MNGGLKNGCAQPDYGDESGADDERLRLPSRIKQPCGGRDLHEQLRCDDEADAEAMGEVIFSKLRGGYTSELWVDEDLHDPE